MNELNDPALFLASLILNVDGKNRFRPVISKSEKWLKWVTTIGKNTCWQCIQMHNQIFDRNNIPDPEPPVHDNCKCLLESISSILAGSATVDGVKGADYFIKHYKSLPSNYDTKVEAKRNGWKNTLANLKKVLPNAVIGGDVFYNDKKKLPESPNRVWYEADINYFGGYRNSQRILYSNDGLIFATYDHYSSFYEIK